MKPETRAALRDLVSPITQGCGLMKDYCVNKVALLRLRLALKQTHRNKSKPEIPDRSKGRSLRGFDR